MDVVSLPVTCMLRARILVDAPRIAWLLGKKHLYLAAISFIDSQKFSTCSGPVLGYARATLALLSRFLFKFPSITAAETIISVPDFNCCFRAQICSKRDPGPTILILTKSSFSLVCANRFWLPRPSYCDSGYSGLGLILFLTKFPPLSSVYRCVHRF